MLIWKLKEITYKLGQNDSLLKENYSKEIQSFFQTFEHFRKCCFKRTFYSCKLIVGFFDVARWDTALVLKQIKRTYIKISIHRL